MTNKREVQRIHQWKFGQDPQDPDAELGSGWEYATVDVQAPPVPPNAPEVVGGPDSEFPCMQCKRNTYRIIDHKDVHIVTGYGIGREEFKDTKLLLVCPTCRHGIQMYQSGLEQYKATKEEK
jgi:hypothetical protein